MKPRNSHIINSSMQHFDLLPAIKIVQPGPARHAAETALSHDDKRWVGTEAAVFIKMGRFDALLATLVMAQAQELQTCLDRPELAKQFTTEFARLVSSKNNTPKGEKRDLLERQVTAATLVAEYALCSKDRNGSSAYSAWGKVLLARSGDLALIQSHRDPANRNPRESIVAHGLNQLRGFFSSPSTAGILAPAV